MNSPVCEVHRLGLIDYQKAWDLQNQFAAEIAAEVVERPARRHGPAQERGHQVLAVQRAAPGQVHPGEPCERG